MFAIYNYDGMLGLESGDEIIAGARLQWSASAGFSSSYFGLSLESTEFARRVGALRSAMERSPDLFQSIQVAPTRYDNTSSIVLFRNYPGVIVIEFTSPINRRLKADIRYDLEQLAKGVGLAIDPNPAHNNIRIVRQGVVQSGTPGRTPAPGGLPAEPGLPTYEERPRIPGGGGDPGANQQDFLPSLAKGLGISTPIVLGGLLLLGLVLLKR